MMKTSIIRSSAFLAALAAAFVLASGQSAQVRAQRDPFKKAGWAQPKKQGVKPTTAGSMATKSTPPVSYAPPAIEARIEYYKKLREAAAASGSPLPKVTSVLTLNELAVTGIFKTPRGYAAMVEATPIKLSYTISPGEKFFDGQLVAVEENRLVFRRVTKIGEGKFVASVENKSLRTFSMKAAVEGTAPTGAQPDKPVEVASNEPPASTDKTASKDGKPAKPAGNPFLSPLDEMNKQPAAAPEKAKNDKAKKPAPAKKPTKVAKNDGN